MKIAILYCLFAIIATVFNIGTQELSLSLYAGAHAISISIVLGTLIGLVVKYILDKRYIFRYHTQSAQQNTTTFLLYAITGVLTTIIFWGLELSFDAIWATKEMRYCGGIIGLAIGYCTKYQLDKRFVFKKGVL